MKEKVNQNEWVINYCSACDRGLHRSGGLGVRQGGTGGRSGLDQQPQHHVTVVGLLMAAGVCRHPFKH